MALIDTSVVDFVKTLNRETLVPLDHSQFILSPVYPMDGERLLTQVRFTAVSDYQYRGSEVLTYERLDLAYLDTLLFQPPRLYPPDGRLYGILDELADGMGIQLEEVDVFDADITEASGVFTVELKARPESYRWVGEYTLQFRGLPRLDSIITYDHVVW